MPLVLSLMPKRSVVIRSIYTLRYIWNGLIFIRSRVGRRMSALFYRIGFGSRTIVIVDAVETLGLVLKV